jgi:hypothetical protein
MRLGGPPGIRVGAEADETNSYGWHARDVPNESSRNVATVAERRNEQRISALSMYEGSQRVFMSYIELIGVGSSNCHAA